MGVAGIAVLGPLVVDGGAVSLGPRDRVVLVALAVHPGEVVSAERLADALWGEQPPASWNKVVAGCVMRLRRALGTEAIDTTSHGYRLAVPAEAIDTLRFERLVGRGRQLLSLGAPERAAYVIGEALALWQGQALLDVEGWEPTRIEAARLEELRLEAEEVRIDACLRVGQHREVLGEAQVRVAEAPLRERRWALLALAEYQGGRQAEALRTLHRARTVLATELGLDPGPDLVALEQAILRQDPALVAEAVRTESSDTCPYPGLVAYDVADAEGFFGRDAEVTVCLQRLAATRMLAVVGPSGCGKSSLVRAGVAAALQRNGRRVVVVTPGAHPLDALTALPATGEVVLVIDQCEEAVSLCPDPTEQVRFFAAVVELADRVPVIAAVRADRLVDVSAHPGFARLVERGLFLLGMMDEANLRAAIEGPAHQAGLLLEPGLVDLLVRDVEGEPGALPLLSHALRQTWERREGRTLTVAGYRETGGIRGAVARSAEAVYERVPPEQRPLLRDLLLRLVAPSPDGEPIRGRVARRGLAIDDDHEQLIEQLVAARLVTSDDGVVELAHECLARAWPRLRAWLDDDVEGQRIFRHLVGTADAWDTMGRPDSELYRGARLVQALAWQRDGHTGAGRSVLHADLTPTERQFLDAGRKLARHDARINRRRQTLAVAVGVMVVAALVAGAVAIRQRERADTAVVTADARRAVALALDTDDVDHSLLLAAEAIHLDDSPDTRASLLAALLRSPALIGSMRSDGGQLAVDVSPDGEVLAGGDTTTGTSFHNADTLEQLGVLDEPPFRLEYRSDGQQLALSTSRYVSIGSPQFDPVPVLLIEPATFEPQPVQLGGLPDGPVEAWDLDYSADGRFLAVSFSDYDDDGSFENTVMLWDVAVPERPVQQFRTGPGWAVALSPDGSLVYEGTHDPPALTVHDAATGEPLRSIAMSNELALGTTTSEDPSDTLEVSPDGTTLAVVDVNEVVLLDAATLTEQRRLRGHSGIVRTLQFSRDGSLLASGSDDRTVLVSEVATGGQRGQFAGHAGSVRSLAFGRDDLTLYSVSIDGRLLAWDLRGDRRFISRTAEVEPEISSGPFGVPAPDGQSVAYYEFGGAGGWAQNLQFLDVGTGHLGDLIAAWHSNLGPSWRPSDTEQFATTDEDGFVRVWNWRKNELVAERQVVASYIAGISYTADGRRILVALRSGTVLQVDADSLEPVGSTVMLEGQVDEVFASPDERTAIALLVGGGYAVIDLVDGVVLHEDNFGFEASFVDYSPDGRWLAVGGLNGHVGVLDLDTHDWARAPVPGHTHIVLRVAFSPNGAAVASAGLDGRVSVWDGHTADLVATVVPGRPDVAAAVEFLPDGHTVIISTRDGDVYTWDTRLEHWIEFACTVAGRNLTADEWSEAFGDRPYRETCPTE